MDRDVIESKLESLRRCLKRIKEKTPSNSEILKKDPDLQDIIIINLERAVQVSVDIACHIISEGDNKTPETMSDSFLELEEMKIIDDCLAEKMAKSVGFRNIAVHSYQDIDFDIVFKIATKHIVDFENFAKAIVKII